MRKVTITLLILSIVSPVTARAKEQWYWVSIPNGPETGYFIEGPNTVGQTSDTSAVRGQTSAVYSTISAVYTPLPDNFMEVMEETKNLEKCSEKLDEALDKLRDFDSENKILYEIKSSVDINEESYGGREKLLEKILSDAKKCLIEVENKEHDEERLIQDENHQKEIEKAIKECNFKFFEQEMTNGERRETYKERMACKENKTPVTEVSVSRDDLLKQIQSLLELIIQLKSQLALKQSQ